MRTSPGRNGSQSIPQPRSQLSQARRKSRAGTEPGTEQITTHTASFMPEA